MAPRTEPDVYSYPNGPLPASYTLNISSARTRQRGYLNSTFVENFLKRGHAEETREYIEEHRIAEIIEPILIELIINGAQNGTNPKNFLLEKLKEIREKGLDGVKWNHFIPFIRPDQKSMTTKTRDEIERIDSYGPSEEKFYVAAYNFRYKKLKAEFLNVWQIFVEQRKERRRIKAIQNKMAKEHFEKSIQTKALKNWFSITRLQAARNHEASKKLAKIYCLHFGKFYVRAWDAFTKQSLKTKRYFDQIEKGEIEDYNALLSNKDADAIYRLPRVIAIKIFSYLNIEEISICRAVSREWNIITQAPSLWSTIDYSVCRHQVSDYAAKRHAEIARLYLSKLNLSSTMLETSSYRAFAMCRNVQHLSLSGCRFLNDEQAVILLEGFRALLTLDLSKTSITDTTIRALSKYGTNLQVLNLAYCTNFTTKGLLYLSGGEGCRMLKFLDMSGCLQISTQGFAALASLLNYLKSLILDDLYSLENEAVQVFLQKAKGLEEISLLSAGRLSNAAFRDLENYSNLRKFALSKNFKVSDSLLSKCFRFCSKLSTISIRNCPQVGDDLLRTFGSLRSLRDVDLSSCPCITDAGVRHLVDGPSGPHLTHLNLSSINGLTDVAMYRITSKCQKLVFLDMSYNERITDSGFELLSSLYKLEEFKCRGSVIGSHGASVIGKIRSIRKLDFAECQRLEDLEKITKNFNPDLTHLNFSIIRGLTNNGIKHLAFNCRNLESIRIAGCPELTDVAIQYIAGVCRFLKHIDISGLPHVSDRSVKYLKKGCRDMNHLQAKYSSSITKEAIVKAKKWFAKVEFSSHDPPIWWSEAYERIDKILEPPEGWPAADLDPVSKSVNAVRRPSQSDIQNRPQTTTGAVIDSNAKTKELQELRFSIADSPQFCLGQYRKLTRAHKKPRRGLIKQMRPVTAPTSPLPPLTPRPRSQMSM